MEIDTKVSSISYLLSYVRAVLLKSIPACILEISIFEFCVDISIGADIEFNL